MKFVALLLALSLPFWLIGGATGGELLPGLPVGALMFVCPATAASILTYRERGAEGVIALLKRSFDGGRIRPRIWYAPITMLMPGVTAMTCGVMAVSGAHPPPVRLSWGPVLAMLLAFIVAGIGEELGWSGYATDRMRARWSALQAGLVLGVVWALWHFVPLLQAHRTAAWIAWWSLYTVALRVLIVWLYYSTGRSVFAAALFHAFTDVSGVMFAAYYDPRITGVIVAAAAVLVTVAWGPRALAKITA